MALRLVLGAVLWPDQRWFAARLPACFHLVLAGFGLVVGTVHARGVRGTRD